MFLSIIHAASTVSGTIMGCQIRYDLCPQRAHHLVVTAMKAIEQCDSTMRQVSKSAWEGLIMRSETTPKKEPKTKRKVQHSGEDIWAKE